jgi:hypothetical protein
MPCGKETSDAKTGGIPAPKKKKEKEKALTDQGFCLGGADRSRTGLNGFAGRCITALLPRRYAVV